jgi:hypothetical protein
VNTPRFTPMIDQQVIDGFLGDQQAMLGRLAKMGFCRKSVLKRASDLGITKDLVRQCGIGGATLSMRRCLSCDAMFLSQGPQHRLCNRCRVKQ